jgi:hypothetical protein
MKCVCIVISSLICPALQYFSILSHKGYDFFLSYRTQNTSFRFLYNFTWNTSQVTKKWRRYDHKYMLVFVLSTRYSCHILMKRIFSTDFRKILKYQILQKSVQWEQSCSMRTHARTGGHEDANSRFRNFANEPKNDVLECLTGILYSM